MSLYVKTGACPHSDENPAKIRGLGFRPKIVIAWTQTEMYMKTASMSSALSVTFDNARRETDAISISDDGFEINGEPQLMSGRFSTVFTQADFRPMWWAAIGGDDVFEGSYSGNGTSQSISLGFEPGFLCVKGDSTARVALFRTNAMNAVDIGAGAGDIALKCDGGTAITDAITAVSATDFSVGAHAEANTNGQLYWYWGVKQSSADLATGAYLGTGSGSVTPSTGLARRTRFALVGFGDETYAGAWEAGAYGWGEPFSGGVADGATRDDFTAWGVGDFTVDISQNTNGRDYYWVAFAGSDLSGKNTNRVHVSQVGLEVLYTPTDVETMITQAVLEAVVMPDSRESRVGQFTVEVVVEEVVGGERGLNRGLYRGIKRGFVDG